MNDMKANELLEAVVTMDSDMLHDFMDILVYETGKDIDHRIIKEVIDGIKIMRGSA